MNPTYDKLFYTYHKYIINDTYNIFNSYIINNNPCFNDTVYFRIEFVDNPSEPIRYFRFYNNTRSFIKIEKEEYDNYYKREILLKAIKELE
jgi:hypothetical protein